MKKNLITSLLIRCNLMQRKYVLLICTLGLQSHCKYCWFCILCDLTLVFNKAFDVSFKRIVVSIALAT